MRAYVRQGDSSDSINWRSVPPQEVSALPQDFPRDVQPADIFQSSLFVGFLEPVIHPFAKLAFFLEILL